ncbi:hypothetical protein NE865_03634 [Phthorimaea operculella]|nr:hypothetical protein NE865_03634 [Phthorimaea operculella]
MGKFKMPNVQEFLKLKRIYDPIKEPVWVYIEKEMRANAAKKPYNTKVGNWLLFCKDLRYHYFRQAKYKYNRLCRECGPVWYLEYSMDQRRVLSHLREYIHEDLLEDVPTRVRQCLWDLGVTIHFPYDMLMTSMEESLEDAGLFMWILYSKYYKVSPSVLRPIYDLNSMLMMSAMVFIDLEECVDLLNKITVRVERPPAVPKKKKPTYFEPDVKYGAYLQMMRVPLYSTHPLHIPKPKKPMPLHNKIRLRSDESYENLLNNTTFMEKRRQRNIKLKLVERKCTYKFWDPPASWRNEDPKKAAYNLKLRMYKRKARPRHLRYKPPYENTQFSISTVSYSAGRPVFVLATIVNLSTGFVLIHGGIYKFGEEYISQICGMWGANRRNLAHCPKACDCAKWEEKVIEYLHTSKCYCGHYYDFENTSVKDNDVFFYPPTRHMPLIFDHAKIYQPDPFSEHVVKAFKAAMNSETTPDHDVFFYPPTRHMPLIFDHAKIYQPDPFSEHVVKAFKAAMNSETTPDNDVFFYPPTRHMPLIFDHARIYQPDPFSEHVVKAFKAAMNSETTPPDPFSEHLVKAFKAAMNSETTPSDSGRKTLDIRDLPGRELLKIFFADLADTPLLIPHLPQANLLNNLQEWVRKRVMGNISPAKHKQLMLKSQRRWLDLKHIDFRAQAYFIPFTLKQLQKMTWAHRGLIQKLFTILLKNFEMRTRQNQLEQSRLWWSTMAYDVYPSESFLDVFFTYMPGRFKDTMVVNPYCNRTMQYVGKTCPLTHARRSGF